MIATSVRPFARLFLGKHSLPFQAVCCVRWNPHIFRRERLSTGGGGEATGKSINVKPRKADTFCVCAVGSRDRGLTFWRTGASRPLCSLKAVFSNTVTDLSWGLKGRAAVACSIDGTVVIIDFGITLGTSLSSADTLAFLIKAYGNLPSLRNALCPLDGRNNSMDSG